MEQIFLLSFSNNFPTKIPFTSNKAVLYVLLSMRTSLYSIFIAMKLTNSNSYCFARKHFWKEGLGGKFVPNPKLAWFIATLNETYMGGGSDHSFIHVTLTHEEKSGRRLPYTCRATAWRRGRSLTHKDWKKEAWSAHTGVYRLNPSIKSHSFICQHMSAHKWRAFSRSCFI